MHDRLDHHRMNDEASLTSALRALPALAPARDALPELLTRIRRRHLLRRTVWFTLPAAFAAGIALTFAWPQPRLHRSMPAPVRIAQQAPARITPNADLAALRTSSSQWQAWVAALDRDGAPLNGAALASAVALQDRIGLVDVQLSAARDPATASGLWEERITLLQRLGLLHLQPYRVARQTAADHQTYVM